MIYKKKFELLYLNLLINLNILYYGCTYFSVILLANIEYLKKICVNPLLIAAIVDQPLKMISYLLKTNNKYYQLYLNLVTNTRLNASLISPHLHHIFY